MGDWHRYTITLSAIEGRPLPETSHIRCISFFIAALLINVLGFVFFVLVHPLPQSNKLAAVSDHRAKLCCDFGFSGRD